MGITNILTKILIGLVALLHIWFLVLEMFLWTKPIGLKTFGVSLEKAQEMAVLAANQGLYNGFLAAGLLWSLVYPDPFFARQIASFFLVCVGIAGLYGAYSVNIRILYVQGLPAILALLLILLAK